MVNNGMVAQVADADGRGNPELRFISRILLRKKLARRTAVLGRGDGRVRVRSAFAELRCDSLHSSLRYERWLVGPPGFEPGTKGL